MSKPCKYKDVENGGCSCDKHYRDRDGINHCIMYPNTTEKCNMKMRPKPAKVKRIRAYCAINNVGIAYAVKYATESDYWDKRVWTPCTILISAKYLAKDKGRKG